MIVRRDQTATCASCDDPKTAPAPRQDFPGSRRRCSRV
ncbi:hypothetical protein C4K39_2765 [Pseudomonas sessilinigenes]|nr:hypothetical protein C4K39_2765 [Pseudomonas sessilinigenes]